MQASPELGHKLRPSIRDYRERSTIKFQDVINVETSKLLHRICVSGSNELGTFRELIHYDLDKIIALWGVRQAIDEVHANVYPLPLWDKKRLE